MPTWDKYREAGQEAVEGAAEEAGGAAGAALGGALAGPAGAIIGEELGGELVGDLVDWIKGLFGCHGAPQTAAGYGRDDAYILIGKTAASEHHSHTRFCAQGDTDGYLLGLRDVLFPIITRIGFPPMLRGELTRLLTFPRVPELETHEGRTRADQIFWPGGICPPDYHGRTPNVTIPWSNPAFKAWQENAQASQAGTSLPHPGSVKDVAGAPPSDQPTPMSTSTVAGAGIGAAVLLTGL